MAEYTAKDLKKRLTDYLMSMNLDKMDMCSLSTYTMIVKNIDDMEKPGYAETLAALALNATTSSSAKDMMEVEKNG